MKDSCTGCGSVRLSELPGWYLKNYYGLTGYFCKTCYGKVSHNSYGEPQNPEEFTFMLLKLSGKQEKAIS